MASNSDGRVPTLLTQLNLHYSDKPQDPSSEVVTTGGGGDVATTNDTQQQQDAFNSGTYQKQKIAMPKMNDNGLNKAMAEAAAAKYEKDKEKIQKACAEIENPTTEKEAPPSNNCCVIL